MELFEATSIWSIAIGKTMVHSLWIGLLILALLRFTLAWIPARSAGIRYGISVFSLFLLFFSALTVFLLLYEAAGPSQELAGIKAWITKETGNGLFPGRESAPRHPGFLFTLFGYIYFFGVLCMIGRSALAIASMKKLQKEACIPPPNWQERFLQLCNKLEIKRYVAFLKSDLVQGPLLLSYLKPAVIVPAGMLSNLPVDQVETILIHELYHLKRKDYLVNAMQLFIEGILFYHPVAWLISGAIRSEREHCCDDGVLRLTENPVNYAKALLHIAEQQQYTRLVPGAVGSDKHQFSSRIKRILNYNAMKTNMRDKILALSLLAGSLLLLLTISSFSAGPSFIRNSRFNEALFATQDTIPKKVQPAQIEETEEPGWEANRKEMEEALEEIEELDLEAIREEALEEIEEADWEALEEIEELNLEAIREEALAEIEEADWETMRVEIEEAHREALREIQEIDWEEFRAEMELNFSEMKMDMEEIKLEIQKSIDEINWEEIEAQIREELEKARTLLDSVKIEMDH